MLFNPHKLGVHKVLQHIPLNALFDIPYKAALKKAVNIADLRTIAKARSHKVRLRYVVTSSSSSLLLLLFTIVNAMYAQLFAFACICFACIHVSYDKHNIKNDTLIGLDWIGLFSLISFTQQTKFARLYDSTHSSLTFLLLFLRHDNTQPFHLFTIMNK
jgi:hypothetical protein